MKRNKKAIFTLITETKGTYWQWLKFKIKRIIRNLIYKIRARAAALLFFIYALLSAALGMLVLVILANDAWWLGYLLCLCVLILLVAIGEEIKRYYETESINKGWLLLSKNLGKEVENEAYRYLNDEKPFRMEITSGPNEKGGVTINLKHEDARQWKLTKH